MDNQLNPQVPDPVLVVPTVDVVADPDLQYELVQLPSGAMVRIDRHVSYGELLVSGVITLLLVVQVGRFLFERIRGVL